MWVIAPEDCDVCLNEPDQQSESDSKLLRLLFCLFFDTVNKVVVVLYLCSYTRETDEEMRYERGEETVVHTGDGEYYTIKKKK
ncbi:hypothetical protein HanXRQr2_Chr16g0726901 [Helianthus annuus]|uniref:Uncharacterized protein n=1 Tax=Helianthus annuus TaxID=4232 RepID=A0A9K3GWQ4_HELAN|nr:hypothetical protein HanXRQr2_Chr16g0726901 [Helianthus annuus]